METAAFPQLLLHQALDCLPDAALLVDRFGDAIAWNRAMEELTGVPRAHVIGTDIYAHAVCFFAEARHNLIDLALKDSPSAQDGPIASKGHTLSREAFVSTLRDGPGRYLRATASPLFDEDGNLLGAIEFIRDITETKRFESRLIESEKLLDESIRQIEEFNTAFRVFTKQQDDYHSELEESIASNLRESVLPHIEKLGKTRLDATQMTHLLAIDANIRDLLSPFLKNISSRFPGLTPMETQIAELVKNGKSTKEIAQILNIAEKTVSTHRYNLRTKLGLKNKKASLLLYLLSLAQ